MKLEGMGFLKDYHDTFPEKTHLRLKTTTERNVWPLLFIIESGYEQVVDKREEKQQDSSQKIWARVLTLAITLYKVRPPHSSLILIFLFIL